MTKEQELEQRIKALEDEIKRLHDLLASKANREHSHPHNHPQMPRTF